MTTKERTFLHGLTGETYGPARTGPQNTVHTRANTGTAPRRMLSAQNRIFKTIGYDAVAYPR